ncbi:hypothetical protein Hanom_Chr03g00273311 [Helianthus anomalus]
MNRCEDFTRSRVLLSFDFKSMTPSCDGDETMVSRAGLTHWSRQEGLIPSSRGSLAGSSAG